ncbi:hypothetical protein RJT34_09695 [Clitoria ternatea]|uniref:Uncharacterized protein n=1 Tax=Clitoria ternatea TaxID=43366 RepID=A0AAN9K7R3_CLITE
MQLPMLYIKLKPITLLLPPYSYPPSTPSHLSLNQIMGCCISKCRPDKHPLEEQHHFNHLQDKLVISQAVPSLPPTPPPPTLYSTTKISPYSPPSPTSSTSSISSFTCTTSNTISSASSLSTASSSSLSSKDKSFSNEFLLSCYKENPHIARINSLREASLSLIKPKSQYKKINHPSPGKPNNNFATLKQSPTQNVFSMPQKRMRSNSPTNLTRQKSFRREPERHNVTINSASNIMQGRTLGSPSPSRRFNGDKCGTGMVMENSVSKRMMSPKVSVSAIHSHSCLRKESIKAASPNNSSPKLHSGLRHRETKIDESVVKDVVCGHDMDLTMMEDIDNPLISLDCFIFL